MKRPRLIVDSVLLSCSEEALGDRLDEVAEYLSWKSRDRQMVGELLKVCSLISIHAYKNK